MACTENKCSNCSYPIEQARIFFNELIEKTYKENGLAYFYCGCFKSYKRVLKDEKGYYCSECKKRLTFKNYMKRKYNVEVE